MNARPYEDLVKDVNSNYLDMLIKRNPGLIEAATALHRSGDIPPNTYLLDLDAHRKNARLISDEARRNDISLYFMSKQVGRNPLITAAVLAEGFRGVVCVEVQCAKALNRYGMRIGHVGHLVQVPVSDIEYVLEMDPEVWTVYSVENARLISRMAEKRNKTQRLLVQPVGDRDIFFETMTGGILETDLVDAVAEINALPNVQVVGTTSFPCLLFDVAQMQVRPTPNFYTATRAAEELVQKLGLEISQINTPGSNQVSTMKMIKEGGATHAEPGTSVSGANTSQIFTNEPEIPAYLYLTEVSHALRETLHVYGGGLAYPGGGDGTHDGKLWVGGSSAEMHALIGSSLESAVANRVKAKNPGTDPFNYNLSLFPEGRTYKVGDTVIYAFGAPQIFTTRAWHAVVEGVQENNPRLLGIFDQGDNLIDRHGRLMGEQAVRDMIRRL